jgi:ABC-type Zn uptake system ZnuABC Zn-binding protein ZnuA
MVEKANTVQYKLIIEKFKEECFTKEENWYKYFCKRYYKKDISIVLDYIANEYDAKDKKKIEQLLREEMVKTIEKFEH